MFHEFRGINLKQAVDHTILHMPCQGFLNAQPAQIPALFCRQDGAPHLVEDPAAATKY
jgi:hypothetical protein